MCSPYLQLFTDALADYLLRLFTNRWCHYSQQTRQILQGRKKKKKKWVKGFFSNQVGTITNYYFLQCHSGHIVRFLCKAHTLVYLTFEGYSIQQNNLQLGRQTLIDATGQIIFCTKMRACTDA